MGEHEDVAALAILRANLQYDRRVPALVFRHLIEHLLAALEAGGSEGGADHVLRVRSAATREVWVGGKRVAWRWGERGVRLTLRCQDAQGCPASPRGLGSRRQCLGRCPR